MRESVLNWLKLHEDEIAVFLWAVALLFIVRASGMILNNYAETAFLKRYGIEYLPLVNMINTVATFFVTGVMATFMSRVAGARILLYLFVLCALSVAAIRAVIPMGLELVYPLLFMLKSQFELLQALLFWNLANDLFNTRQSKRIFPLLTAGGVVGLILGSFGTPYLAAAFQMDNLLFVYVVTALAGAVVVKGMGRKFPAIFRMEAKQRGKGGEKRPSMADEVRRVWPLLRQSTLFKIVLVLTFMPNVVIPIMNYQFNFTVDRFFPTESGMIAFFSYFRGVLNIVSLFILLFVGRIYGYFGLPIALMLHPVNYAAAFLALFFRFDVVAAIYARMSTNIIRTTINLPANAILIGLFPENYRNMVRPFLRGTVVRAGLLLGSGIILVFINYFHPRYLSLAALPFVLAWVAAPVILKARYPAILKNLISTNMLDIRGLEAENPGALFRKDGAGRELVGAFLSARGEDAIWYARLLRTLDVENLDALILDALEHQDEKTRIRLIGMLSARPDTDTAERLEGFLDPDRPGLNVAVLRALGRARGGVPEPGKIRPFMADPDPEVRGYAAACLYTADSVGVGSQINAWLASADPEERRSGVIAAGGTMDSERYAAHLENMLRQPENEPIFDRILHALSMLESPVLDELAAPLLNHPASAVRHAALMVFPVAGDESLKKVIPLLGDSGEAVRELAKEKIRDAPYTSGQALIEALGRPGRHLRENVFELLEALDIKGIDLYRFTDDSLLACYGCMARAAALEGLPDSRIRGLLYDHLMEKKDRTLEDVIRVMAIHSGDSRMHTARRGLFSKDVRVRGNSIELLGDILDRSLFLRMQPLLEGFSLYRRVRAGRKFYRLPRYNPAEVHLLTAFLESPDWIEAVLGTSILRSMADGGKREVLFLHANIIEKLCSSAEKNIREAALALRARIDKVDAKGQIMNNELPVSDKILLLRNIGIFSGLAVSELGAIAAVTEERVFEAEETVIREGDPGEKVFLIVDGDVAVYKKGDGESEIRLDTMGRGDYFGEMALFEEAKRSATIRTTRRSRFLVLHKQEFNELVREYPGIALQICTALSHRLRHLQGHVARAEQQCR